MPRRSSTAAATPARRRPAAVVPSGRSPAPVPTPPGAADRPGWPRPRRGGPVAAGAAPPRGPTRWRPGSAAGARRAGGRRSSGATWSQTISSSSRSRSSRRGLAGPGTDPQHGHHLTAVAEVECLGRAVRAPGLRDRRPRRPRPSASRSTSDRLADRSRSDDTTPSQTYAGTSARSSPSRRPGREPGQHLGRLGPVAVVEAFDAAVQAHPEGMHEHAGDRGGQGRRRPPYGTAAVRR